MFNLPTIVTEFHKIIMVNYLLVIFTDENETAIIPDSCIDGSEAYWPPYKHSGRINSAVAKQEVPGHNWRRFPFRVPFTGALYLSKFRLLNYVDYVLLFHCKLYVNTNTCRYSRTVATVHWRSIVDLVVTKQTIFNQY